jgi:hypothetical protein
MRIPTDREILAAIYSRYYVTFAGYTKGDRDRTAKVYVPVNCKDIAQEFNVDGDIVFGRLYYHLEEKFGYQRRDGSRVNFFALRVGDDVHCVNFPLLASALASLQEEHSRYRWATGLSIASTTIALVALGMSLGSAIWGK